FQWQGSWGNVYVAYKRTSTARPSHDPQCSLYWGKAFGHAWVASTGVFWTQNRNRGDALTANLTGKRFAFLIENGVWWRTVAPLSVGTMIRVSRNVFAADARLLIYPTIGVRYAF